MDTVWERYISILYLWSIDNRLNPASGWLFTVNCCSHQPQTSQGSRAAPATVSVPAINLQTSPIASGSIVRHLHSILLFCCCHLNERKVALSRLASRFPDRSSSLRAGLRSRTCSSQSISIGSTVNTHTTDGSFTAAVARRLPASHSYLTARLTAGSRAHERWS